MDRTSSKGRVRFLATKTPPAEKRTLGGKAAKAEKSAGTKVKKKNALTSFFSSKVKPAEKRRTELVGDDEPGFKPRTPTRIPNADGSFNLTQIFNDDASSEESSIALDPSQTGLTEPSSPRPEVSSRPPKSTPVMERSDTARTPLKPRSKAQRLFSSRNVKQPAKREAMDVKPKHSPGPRSPIEKSRSHSSGRQQLFSRTRDLPTYVAEGGGAHVLFRDILKGKYGKAVEKEFRHFVDHEMRSPEITAYLDYLDETKDKKSYSEKQVREILAHFVEESGSVFSKPTNATLNLDFGHTQTLKDLAHRGELKAFSDYFRNEVALALSEGYAAQYNQFADRRHGATKMTAPKASPTLVLASPPPSGGNATVNMLAIYTREEYQHLRAALTTKFQRQFCSEVTDFLQDLAPYANGLPSHEEAQALFDKYISPGSEKALNLVSPVVQAVREKLEESPFDAQAFYQLLTTSSNPSLLQNLHESARDHYVDFVDEYKAQLAKSE